MKQLDLFYPYARLPPVQTNLRHYGADPFADDNAPQEPDAGSDEALFLLEREARNG